MSQAFWSGKRVFVTGHTGFKGAWLTLWLESMGAKVAGYALPAPTTPNLCEMAAVEGNIVSTMGDVADATSLNAAIRHARPEIVFHLAAQALVRPSYDDPVGTYATNVMGTVNVLESVRQCAEVRSVVIVTSDKCYENRERQEGYREDEAMGGYDPYSSSKGCAELVTSAYARSFFNSGDYPRHKVAIGSGRAGNVIGGGDWAKDRLIPDMMRAIVAGVPVQIRNPHAVRPWQHVLEPLDGYLLLAKRLYEEGPKFSGGWNFGPRDGDTRKVQDIVSKITSRWGDGARWQTDQGAHPHEAHYLKLDCSRANSILGWLPRLDTDTALEWTADWYKAWRANADMRSFTLRQIAAYSSLDRK